MARFSPSALISDCYGSVGDITFFHRDGRCFYRKRPRPGFPGTVAQLERQAVHLRAIEAWRRLDHAVQLEWNAVARSVIVHRPPFDGSTHMSGYNLFVSAYHGFATLDEEHLPTPVAWEPFPVYALEGVAVSCVTGTDTMAGLRLTFRTQSEAEDLAPERYRLLLRLQLTRPVGGRDGGRMRSFLADGFLSGGAAALSVLIARTPEFWELSSSACTVHVRHVLLDVRSGYRSVPRSESFLAELP